MMKSILSIGLLVAILILDLYSQASFKKVDSGAYKIFYICISLFIYAFMAGLLSFISRVVSGKFNYPGLLLLVAVAQCSIAAVNELQWVLKWVNIYTPLPITALLWFLGLGFPIALIQGKIGISSLAVRAGLTICFAGGLTALTLFSPRGNLTKGYTSYPKITPYDGLIPPFFSVGVDSDTFFSEKIASLKKIDH